ncbi:nucleoside-diphosphate-sugar epimerase [Bradyrhizobium sp. LM2.3]
MAKCVATSPIIDDVTRVVSKLIDQVPADDPAAANAPSKVYNVGNHHPEELMHVVGLLEQELGRTAVKELLPMQPGDVLETFADVSDLMRDTGFAPSTPIAHGVRNFVTWYRDHFKV